MGWSTFLTGVMAVCVVMMLTACSPEPEKRYYPLAEPISPAMMRAERPEPYTGSPHAVSCSEDGWCF